MRCARCSALRPQGTGKPTGFAPLKAVENKPEDRAWLSLWVRQLVRAESHPITVQEERMIDEGIAAVMRLPREDRSLDALRTMLGMADAGGIGARLEKWTSRGSMGWVFDNAADRSEEHTSELQSLL